MTIKTNFEFPRGDDPLKNAQRLSQDLSYNFKGVVNRMSASDETIASLASSIAAIPQVVYQDVTASSTGSTAGVTCSHSLGVTPTRWEMIDYTASSTADLAMISRASWSSTNIKFDIFQPAGANKTHTFVIRLYK